MTIANMIACVSGILGLAISSAGCLSDGTETAADTATASAASTVCREVKHYKYTHGATYRWDVTTESGTGRQFVDERRPGYYRQYTVSPRWSDCSVLGLGSWENVTLTSGAITLTGRHNCYQEETGEIVEEYHGSDYQRLLIPQVPFITNLCD